MGATDFGIARAFGIPVRFYSAEVRRVDVVEFGLARAFGIHVTFCSAEVKCMWVWFILG